MRYSFEALSDLMQDRAVRGLSIRRELQPLGGQGELLSPPTFAQSQGEEKGPRYVWSPRRIDDEEVDTCLLDSAASQANRMEEALLELVRSEELELPMHSMEVPGIGTLTDLDLPHRTYDAAVGTAKLKDGTDWEKSDVAMALREASRKQAAPLLEHAPLLLVLGGWDSHSGVAANAWQGRHEKAIWSKIVAVDAHKMNRPGGRLDPMGLPSSQKVDLGVGSKKLVDQGLGVVPPSMEKHPRLSITMRYAEQRSVVSFGVTRKLSFGSSEQDDAGRVFLAALGILAVAALHRGGGHLRSECDLVCERSDGWLIRRDDRPDEVIEDVDVDSALAVVKSALVKVEKTGLRYRRYVINLDIHPALIQAMRRSDT